MTDAQSPQRSAGPRWVRSLVILVLGVSAGAAVASGLPARMLDSVGADASEETEQVEVRVRDTATADTDQVVPGAAEATDPVAAVEAFLTAEADRRLDDAYALLSDEDRAEFVTPAGYVAAHADLLPPVESFEVGDVEEAEGESRVNSEVVFRPALNEVAGLVPGRAEVSWVVVESAGGWGVDLTTSEIVPVFPPDEQASEDVAEWARARVACSTDPEGEHPRLRGVVGAADELCGATEPVDVGAPEPLAETDAAAYLAAYGGEVTEWARVVPVDGAVSLRAIVAPLGDRWTVIGLLTGEGGA